MDAPPASHLGLDGSPTSDDLQATDVEKELETPNADGEIPTCRICRGDETLDEQLFHPCKCSGSIRYVHQTCLMEWLSRSGKRHCELCKTPFRFTKLYDPRMPASVPLPVFCRQAALQAVALTLRLLRWALVLFVWLVWVPWVMRLVWRFLFWLADGAWIEHPFHYDVGLPGNLGTLSISAYSRKALQNTTELVRSVANTTVAKPSLFALFSEHVSKTLWHDESASVGGGNTTTQPLMVRLGSRIFRGLFPPPSRVAPEAFVNATDLVPPALGSGYRKTLLSEVGYLKHFSKWPFVNRLVIDVIEGQMITIFVMVFLILVFLIREWVVQQQPGVGAPRVPEQQPPMVPAAEGPGDANLQQPLLQVNFERAAGPPPGDRDPHAPNDPEIADTEQAGNVVLPEEEARAMIEDVLERPRNPPPNDIFGDYNGEIPATFGTIVYPFRERSETESDTGTKVRYQSITYDSVNRYYSFEELRLEDYRRGNFLPSDHNYPSWIDERDKEYVSSDTSSDVQSEIGNGDVASSVTQEQDLMDGLELADEPSPSSVGHVGQTVSDSAWSMATNASAQSDNDASPSWQTHRPQMPSKDTLELVSRLHRVIEEERNKVAGDRWPGIDTFMDYWRRGNHDPQTVLELLLTENRQEELTRRITQALQRLQQSEESDQNGNESERTSSQGDEQNLISLSQGWQVVDGSSNDPRRDLRFGRGDREIVDGDEAATGASLQAGSSLSDVGSSADEGPSVRDTPVRTFVPQQVADSDPSSLPSTEPSGAVRRPSDAAYNHPDSSTEGGVVTPAGTSDADSDTQGRNSVGPTHGPETLTESQAGARAAAPEAPVHRPPWQILADLMWGGVELLPADQVHVAGQLQPVLQPEVEQEPPAPAPLLAANDALPANNAAAGALPGPDPEVLQAARDAGLDPEDAQAVEDGEELDGLVELVGLEGPLIALLQHAVVCSFIVSLVIFLGIWIPYDLGKVVLVIISNPFTLLVKLPLRWVLFVFEVLLDTAIFLSGSAFFWVDRVIRSTVSPVMWLIPIARKLQENTVIPDVAASFSNRAMKRLIQDFTFSGEGLVESDIPYFSIVAHESLVSMKGVVYGAMTVVYRCIRTGLEDPDLTKHLLIGSLKVAASAPSWILGYAKWEFGLLSRMATNALAMLKTNPLKLRLDFPERTEPLDLTLIHWSAWDRFFAIAIGYAALYLAGSIYTKIVDSFRNPGDQQDETVEIIQQARGVLKVILIISIEMIAFPLYCGLLLDIAMLPLFRDATILSRLAFTARSPWTSLFLHWFVGTCYMFHFALFVSMCRKEMRKGVLYFIRDPDDETFHPVRDVLERNLGGQLRKIAFSALVYGALVIVCLGTVVWGVASLPGEILPVSWSAANPIAELPIDLCVYNFLIPIAVKALNPSKALTSMYKWWFRRCAKILRLSHFLFGDRRMEEEGVWEGTIDPSDAEVASSDAAISPDAMDVDSHDDEGESMDDAGTDKGRKFVRDGRFVRVPATDRVRIPRGYQTFLPVDENDNRLDGKPEVKEGLHAKGGENFKLVYLPPRFQTRIGLFAMLIWAFAAVTGLLTTILPLVIGRIALRQLVPAGFPMNDVHAYIFGAYATGTPLLLIIKYKRKIKSVIRRSKRFLRKGDSTADTIRPLAKRFFKASLRASRVLYFYSFTGFVLPTLFSAVFWFYVAVPIYTLSGDRALFDEKATNVSLIQNWVLGVLFMRVAGRLVQTHQESRITRALYAIVAPTNNGASWLNPDIKLATRAFILPSLLLAGTALLLPLAVGATANTTYFRGYSPEIQTLVFRYSYPAVAGALLAVVAIRVLKEAHGKWRSRIRDEVYLVGERLHNFGERRPVVTGRIASSA